MDIWSVNVHLACVKNLKKLIFINMSILMQTVKGTMVNKKKKALLRN